MKKILLVDDDPLFLNSLRMNLEKDYRVETAPGCIEAMTKMEIEHYDAVVIDYRMTPHDGIELVQRMRFYHILYPVVMITAHGCLEMMRQALEYDVYFVLQKPVHVDKIRLVIAEAVQTNCLSLPKSMDLFYETLS